MSAFGNLLDDKKILFVLAGTLGAGFGCLLTYIDLGYITGVAITGAAIGFVVASAEELLRKVWVEVTEYSGAFKEGLLNSLRLIIAAR